MAAPYHIMHLDRGKKIHFTAPVATKRRLAMWHHNFIEDFDMDGIQPWSRPGSNMTAVPRPYTGIAVKEDGTPFLVHCEAVWGQGAKEQMDPLARAAGGHLIAALAGYHQTRILITWEPPLGL
jgi:hypothetical protein